MGLLAVGSEINPMDDLSEALLLVVDTQVDFVSGALVVVGAASILPVIETWIKTFEAGGRPIVYSMDWHDEGSPHFANWPAHCIARSDGAQIDEGLTYDPVENSRAYTVLKGLGGSDGYSVCSEPSEIFRISKLGVEVQYASLLPVMQENRVKTVLVVGLATDYCVKASVLDLLKMGLDVIVDLDGVCGVDDVTSLGALNEMWAAGARFRWQGALISELEWQTREIASGVA